MTLVLYALNRKFFLMRKARSPSREVFADQADRFHDTVARVLGRVGTTPADLSKSVVEIPERGCGVARACH